MCPGCPPAGHRRPEADLAIFEKLMAIDDEAFLRREFRPACHDLVTRLHARGEMSAEQAEALFEVRRRIETDGKPAWETVPFLIADLESLKPRYLVWRESVGRSERHRWELRWVQSFSYLDRVSAAKRPEELDKKNSSQPIWNDVNRHLGTSATSMPELVEQLGILRFGHRPKVGDTFCGGGSIPFEAARLGCDVYASDLNPIACMLTWGALNIIGASPETAEADRGGAGGGCSRGGPRRLPTWESNTIAMGTAPRLIFIAWRSVARKRDG